MQVQVKILESMVEKIDEWIKDGTYEGFHAYGKGVNVVEENREKVLINGGGGYLAIEIARSGVSISNVSICNAEIGLLIWGSDDVIGNSAIEKLTVFDCNVNDGFSREVEFIIK